MTAFDSLVLVCSVAFILCVAGCTGSTDSSTEPGGSVFEELPVGWTAFPAPPEARSQGASAWAEERLLVWGGHVYTGYSDEVPRADGFTFDARSRTWHAMAAAPLAPRLMPASAWSGRELLIWGGTDERFQRFFRDGAAYDPESDSWRRLPRAPISARAPLSVWTGRELLVWATAVRVRDRPRDGAAYDPRGNTWRRIANAPIELTDATAAWTGREMIVFGAALHGGNFPETRTAIGAAYDPERNTWRRLPDSTLSPQASTAAWTGTELIAWDYGNGTGAYDPLTNDWRKLPDVPLDAGECAPNSIPVGRFVFGDYCGGLVVYEPLTDRWRDISRRELLGWQIELVRADPVALLLGRSPETGEERMLAYRPGN